MAPLKRAHNAGEPRAGPANPGSSENEPRKRPRVSGVLAGSSDSDSESTDSSGSSNPDPDSDSDDEEVRLLRERFALCEENTPMDTGIIERVDCYNFMCHEYFSIELGPLINFIVGKNGSGKSAILTAITLCLGGKASFTNRGQSLKSFIKEGKDSSTVVVRIKNQGEHAYLPNEYGPSIIIERHFSRSGATGYRLKSSTGRVVSTKKTELEAITDFYALQMDNPMNVLSQDMARQFIAGSTPEDKYKFFVKGVQLQQLDQDYTIIGDYTDQMKEKLPRLQEEKDALLEICEKAKRRREKADRQQGLQDKIKSLRAQVAWAQVEEQERLLASRQEDVENIQQKIVELESEIESSDGVFQAADREYDAAKQASESCRAELEGRREERSGVKAKYDEALKERLELKAQQLSITEHLKGTSKQIADTQQKIEEENRRLANLDGGSNSRKLAELEQRKEASNQLQNRYKQHKRERGRLQEDIKRAETELRAANEPVSRKQEELHRAQNRLQELKRDRGQQQTGFSDRMPMLLRAIQQETTFSRQPVGPLGNHMRLLKPQWSSVLENTFGGTLSSFVVTSKQDMNTLSKLMQKVKCPCPILIGNDAGPIDTSAHEPDPEFDTALRVLQIDHDLVRRQLIITNAVEQMVLIEDVEKASSILFDGVRPRNVKRCFCIDKTDKRRGIHLGFTRTGEPIQSPVPAYNGHPRMKTDVETRIRMQQEVVDNLSRDLEELVQKRRSAQQHLEKCKQSLTNHGEQEHELQVESQKAEDVVQDLREEIDRGSLNDGQLNALQSSLDEAIEEKRLNEESYQDGVNAMDEAVQKIKVLKRELAAKDADLSSAEATLRSLQEEENRLSVKRRKALGDKNIAIGRVEEARKNKVDAERQREDVSNRIQEFSEKASMVSPRVAINAGENMSSLEKKLEKFMKDRDRYQQELGASRAELIAAAADAEAAYESSKAQVDLLEKIRKMLLQSNAERRERWKKFRDLITARARVQFQYLLSERGFRGKLLTDHKHRLLDIQIQPDITKKSDGENASSLSGGEKSFSQICLLLALWEAMGSPIRCLDEFDVFMDTVNRKLAIDLLMGAARRSVGRQFILITPGSRSDISFASDVRVKELAEPERGQQTLPFSN